MGDPNTVAHPAYQAQACIGSMHHLLETVCLLQRLSMVSGAAPAGALAARTAGLLRDWIELAQRVCEAQQFQARIYGVRMPEIASVRYLAMEMAAITQALESARHLQPASLVNEALARMESAAGSLNGFMETVRQKTPLPFDRAAQDHLNLLENQLAELAA